MTTVTRPRVALVQSHWKGEPNENLDGVLRLVDRIPDPVDLICLPEFFLGPPWYFPGRAHLRGIVDQTIPGPVTDRFCSIARQRRCYIVCGTLVERDGDRYYNTSALIDRDGHIAGKARKIHRFSAELLSIDAGTEQLLVDTPFGKLGVCVCSDFWIPEMPRMLALKGAEIIAVPGASIVANLGITRPCIQANSSFNVCYTLFTSLVGRASGRRGGREVSIAMGGCSTVTSPEEIVATLDQQEDVLLATLDMDYLRESRTVDLSFKRSLYWCLHGRLPELYQDITRPYVGKIDLRSLLKDYLD
jgi:predicted amidohydrolase